MTMIELDVLDELVKHGISRQQYESFKSFFKPNRSLKYYLQLLKQLNLSIDQALYLLDVIRLESAGLKEGC